MSFPQHDHKSIKKLLKRPFVLAIFLAVLLAGINYCFPQHFGGFLHKIGEPLWKIENTTAEKSDAVFTFFESKQALKKENRELRAKLQNAKADLLKTQELQNRLGSLKEMCGREKDEKNQGTLAAILKRPAASTYDTLILDIGADKQIKKGYLIETKNSIPIGEIKEVHQSTSKAVLFSSPGRKTKVRLKPANVDINAEGRGGGTMSTKIPKSIKVEKGDGIILPGLTTQIFSTVEKIKQRPADPFKTLLFKTPVNIFEISWVRVIKNQQ